FFVEGVAVVGAPQRVAREPVESEQVYLQPLKARVGQRALNADHARGWEDDAFPEVFECRQSAHKGGVFGARGVARRRVAHSVRAQDLGAVVKILLAAAGVAQRQPRPLEQALARAAKPDLFRLLGRRPSTPQALAVSIPARGADVDARKNRGA